MAAPRTSVTPRVNRWFFGRKRPLEGTADSAAPGCWRTKAGFARPLARLSLDHCIAQSGQHLLRVAETLAVEQAGLVEQSGRAASCFQTSALFALGFLAGTAYKHAATKLFTL